MQDGGYYNGHSRGTFISEVGQNPFDLQGSESKDVVSNCQHNCQQLVYFCGVRVVYCMLDLPTNSDKVGLGIGAWATSPTSGASFFMFFVYILENSEGLFYTGHTDDLETHV
jgi:hypothetical protein